MALLKAWLRRLKHCWPWRKKVNIEVLDTDATRTPSWAWGMAQCWQPFGGFVGFLGVLGFCRLGWKLPWAVRVRVAELLLPHAATSFGEASLMGLREALAQHLWPPLGVTAEIQDALQPFIYFQQFWRTGMSYWICWGPCCLLQTVGTHDVWRGQKGHALMRPQLSIPSLRLLMVCTCCVEETVPMFKRTTALQACACTMQVKHLLPRLMHLSMQSTLSAAAVGTDAPAWPEPLAAAA